MILLSLLGVPLLALGTPLPDGITHGPFSSTEESAEASQAKPFPLKSTTLKTEGAQFYVAGRVRLPHNASVVSVKTITIEGRGEKPVLEVSGKLELKAALGDRIQIRNLTIEVMPDCKDLLIMRTDFSASSHVISSEEGASKGNIYLHDLRLRDTSRIDVQMSGGQFDLHDSGIDASVRIRGVDASEKNRAKLKVILLNNQTRNGGFKGGLELENAWDALIRNCDLAGPLTRIKRCQKLDFDGNNVRSKLFEVLQEDTKDFKKTKIMNCDMRTPTTRIFAPIDPKKPDHLTRFSMQGCWFSGVIEDKAIRAKYVIDNGRDPENGMLVTFRKTSKGARGLGGAGR